MAAYLIADIEVTDAAGYEEYRKGVPETIAAHGGRYLVRGGAVEVREGDWSPRRLVILEFPTMARLRAWYESPEYQPLRRQRERSANSRLVMVEGI